MRLFTASVCLYILVSVSVFACHQLQRKTRSSSDASALPQPAARVVNEQQSVFTEFAKLARDTPDAINLGQGAPDMHAPKYLIDSLHNATNQVSGDPKINQYTRSYGHPRLVRALLEYYRNRTQLGSYMKDANDEILVTVGATEALFLACMSYLNPGDEAIVIDPAYDVYAPMIAKAGARSVHIPLRIKQDFPTMRLTSMNAKLDMKELESKISNETRLLILNTPNNPMGKMYNLEELRAIAALCIKHNLLVIADEVYEHIYYNTNEHISIASLPNMWQRTITIGSAGKLFSVTGWKVGWAIGPRALIRPMQLLHQFTVTQVATPLQEALARALENELDVSAESMDSYWVALRHTLGLNLERTYSALEGAHFTPIMPQGGYFMLAEFSNASIALRGSDKFGDGELGAPNTTDFRFARVLAKRNGIISIPASAFYSQEFKHLGTNYVRFCFIKTNDTMNKFVRVLSKAHE